MEMNNILKTINENEFEINFDKYENFFALTVKDLEDFYDKCIQTYISTGKDLIFTNNEDPQDVKKAILHTFFGAFFDEWKESLKNIKNIKELVNPQPLVNPKSTEEPII